MSDHIESNGDLTHRGENGDYVRLHLSRFHGVIVTAGRTYLNGGYREVSAYLGDPQVVKDWLNFITATPPTTEPRQQTASSTQHESQEAR